MMKHQNMTSLSDTSYPLPLISKLRVFGCVATVSMSNNLGRRNVFWVKITWLGKLWTVQDGAQIENLCVPRSNLFWLSLVPRRLFSD